jgi:hypothetical protein
MYYFVVIQEMRREAGFHDIVALSFSFKNILKIGTLRKYS